MGLYFIMDRNCSGRNEFGKNDLREISKTEKETKEERDSRGIMR